MSEPEEPELQWLEDTIVQLGSAAFALLKAVFTICMCLLEAVWAVIKPTN